MPPKLYLFHGSTSVRSVLITAKALGVVLKHHTVDYEPEEFSDPDYLKHNPHNTVPTLDDDGRVLWGSHAINTYLVEKYGKEDSLYPADAEKRAAIDERLEYEAKTLIPLLRSIQAQLVEKREMKGVPRAAIEDIGKSYEFLESVLNESPWIAGDRVTIADFGLIPLTTSLDVLYPIDPGVYPRVSAWINRARTLPAFHSDNVELARFREFVQKFIC